MAIQQIWISRSVQKHRKNLKNQASIRTQNKHKNSIGEKKGRKEDRKPKDSKKLRTHLDLAIGSGYVQRRVAIICRSMLKKTWVSLQNNLHSFQIPELHCTKQPVFITRSATQSLTHLLFLYFQLSTNRAVALELIRTPPP